MSSITWRMNAAVPLTSISRSPSRRRSVCGGGGGEKSARGAGLNGR